MTKKHLVAMATSGLGLVATAHAQYTLQVLHASDLEGGLDALNRAANFGAIVEHLKGAAPHTVILSGGDNYIPGPFFNAAADRATFRDSGVFNTIYNEHFGVVGYNGLREEGGRVDITIMNLIGFDASAVGNHEFDAGSDAFALIVEEDFRGAAGPDADRWVGAQFPYLSANLDFSGDALLGDLFTAEILPNTSFATGPLESAAGSTNVPKFAPATVISVGGERIGVVGATTPLLQQISSPSGTTVIGGGSNDMAALAAILQPVIDDIADGDDNISGTIDDVNKIILTSHLQQLALEVELIGLLSKVDVVIAGGSDTLLAGVGTPLNPGDTIEADYPVLTSNADGSPAAIVSTDGEYSYVGRLLVEFDAVGVLSSVLPGSGPVATGNAAAAAGLGFADYDALKASTAVDDAIQSLVDAVQSVIIAKDANIAGESIVYLDGRRSQVRTEETNLGDLTADANLAYAQTLDPAVLVSIKNGGGIRASIGEIDSNGDFQTTQANPLSGKLAGEVSQLDIENSLRFNNNLALVTLSASGLLQVIEHAVSASASGNTPGQFPQVGGLAFSFDVNAAPGSRVRSLAIKDAANDTIDVIAEDGAVVGDPGRAIRVVTLGFLAGGGDAYPFPALGTDVLSTPVGEQEAMQFFLSTRHPVGGGTPFSIAETTPNIDGRIQNLLYRSDTANFPPPSAGGKTLTKVGGFQTGIFDGGAAEIVAFDAGSQRIFFTNAEAATVTILDASDPARLAEAGEIDIAARFGFRLCRFTISANPNSVDVHDGLVAVAVARKMETPDGREFPIPGLVAFFDVHGSYLGCAHVGYGPDNLGFTPDGDTVVTANEGEPNGDYSFDPPGSVSVITVNRHSRRGYRFHSRQASFQHFRKGALVADGVRIFGPGASVAQDLEPEFVCISSDSRQAYVTLQENNAVAVVDLRSARVSSISGLGTIDFATESALDASDKDDAINIERWPVKGLFLPDSIACYEVDGKTYLLTANEGDARDYDGFAEEERVKDLVLDPTAFPDAESLRDDEAIGRLTATTADGDPDRDGDIDEIHVFGTRSFTIWEVGRQGKLTRVYDSGPDFEKITASFFPAEFNSTNDENGSFESRSDNKGPEPEGITLGEVDGRTCAFIGLERMGGVMVYDVTDPLSPAFVQYVTGRDFAGDAEAGTAGDLGPEGLKFVSAADSPSGHPLLIVANEVSGNVSVFEIK